ncbi:hypothetical protein [Komagataeibacter sp. FNDCF1]|uniref:hypothetical protein n=1 Tax=Komagataeibacter sp. FNDCF1 TaxID=2878681 RepID=UPI001E312EA3|nr:hypothetical protein [Komagataeibacter sp. FNDCF1]MCE2565540.1 hypothetical protein [Komagataeibacter sp. FNDCF1]
MTESDRMAGGVPGTRWATATRACAGGAATVHPATLLPTQHRRTEGTQPDDHSPAA